MEAMNSEDLRGNGKQDVFECCPNLPVIRQSSEHPVDIFVVSRIITSIDYEAHREINEKALSTVSDA